MKGNTTQDELWKAIIEEFLDDFMRFFYSAFYERFDTSRPYEIMDKELSKIYRETKEKRRRGDKLIKVPMKGEFDQFILILLEVQGYKEVDYARRMYVCQYRLDERYNLPVAALVIYSDKNQQNRESRYERLCLDTKLYFEFPTYVIADHTIEEYEQMDNPFAIVCMVVLESLNNKPENDDELLDLKVQLFRKLLKRNYSKEQIRLLTIFIKEYVNFAEPDFYGKFDAEIDEIIEKSEPMGLEETVIRYRSREAVAEGIKKGVQQGLEQGLELERLLHQLESKIATISQLLNKGFGAVQVSEIFNFDISFVQALENQDADLSIKKLLVQLNKCRKNFSPTFNTDDLTNQIIAIFLSFNFSEKVIAKELHVTQKRVKSIKNL